MTRRPSLPDTPDLTAPALVDRIDPILRRNVVLQVTGLSQSSLYREMREGRFPKPVTVSPGTVGWLQSAVAGWIVSRPEAEGV